MSDVVTMAAERVRVWTEEIGKELVLVVDDGSTRVELVAVERLELAAMGCQRVQTTAKQHAALLFRRAGLPVPPVAGVNVAVIGQPDGA